MADGAREPPRAGGLRPRRRPPRGLDHLHAADRRLELRLLTWNLFHGRSLPPSGRGLYEQFAALLAGWDWDVALLQEVPPWWPPLLAVRARAQERTALTSRNLGLPLRRAVAERRPDLLKSNGGGCNAVLVRGAIADARTLRLRVWPERRVGQLVRLGDGTAVVNYHGSARVRLAEEELARLWACARRFAAGRPLVLGGDLNLREPVAPAGAAHVAARDVDHLFAVGLRPVGRAERLERRVDARGHEVALSDHIPLAVELAGS